MPKSFSHTDTVLQPQSCSLSLGIHCIGPEVFSIAYDTGVFVALLKDVLRNIT